MNSIIFSTFSRGLCILMVAVSLFVLYRGHNEPGGGFVGGLIAAAGLALLALSDGIRKARRALRIHPIALAGLGLVLALLSGIPGLITHTSFLTHWWYHYDSFHVGSALVFDVGVYFVVIGGVLAMILRFYEEESEV